MGLLVSGLYDFSFLSRRRVHAITKKDMNE